MGYALLLESQQKNFDFYRNKSENNHADYWTKHFPAVYHRFIRATYVLDEKIL